MNWRKNAWHAMRTTVDMSLALLTRQRPLIPNASTSSSPVISITSPSSPPLVPVPLPLPLGLLERSWLALCWCASKCSRLTLLLYVAAWWDRSAMVWNGMVWWPRWWLCWLCSLCAVVEVSPSLGLDAALTESDSISSSALFRRWNSLTTAKRHKVTTSPPVQVTYRTVSH